MPRQNVNRHAAPAAVTNAVATLGANVMTARLRRRWRRADLSAKAGLSTETVRRVETGALGTAIGAYVAALWALGLQGPVSELASPERDREGQTLAAARLGQRARPSSDLDDAF